MFDGPSIRDLDAVAEKDRQVLEELRGEKEKVDAGMDVEVNENLQQPEDAATTEEAGGGKKRRFNEICDMFNKISEKTGNEDEDEASEMQKEGGGGGWKISEEEMLEK